MPEHAPARNGRLRLHPGNAATRPGERPQAVSFHLMEHPMEAI